jgi:hypothetical protein
MARPHLRTWGKTLDTTEVKAAGAAKTRGAGPAALMRRLRAIHLYLGALFAPAILFFAFSGAVQEFSLHEPIPGSTYAPPTWVVRLAQAHKHQTLALPPVKPTKAAKSETSGMAGARPRAPAPERVKPQTVAARVFFAASAAGLIASTLIGLYLAFRFTRRPRLLLALIALGLAAPLALLLT